MIDTPDLPQGKSAETAQGTNAARLVLDMDWCEKGVARQHDWNEFAQCRACLGFAQDTNMQFAKRLEKLLNAHSRENASNTPDFILAQYLLACLAAWNRGVQQRETWYGRSI